MKTRIALTLLFACGLTARLHAQSQPYRFEPIHVPGNSDQSRITSIAQDGQGFMWFGTWGGLLKYDGHGFTTYAYDPADSTSLPSNWAECLYVDRAGTLWVGTYGGGLNRFHPETETFTHYRHDPHDATSLSQDSVTVILEDHTGALWVGTMGGLNRFDRATSTFMRFQHDPADPTSLGNNQVRALFEDARGTLWVGTNSPFAGEQDAPGPGGLNRFDRATSTFTRYLHDPENPQSLISNFVTSIYEDSRGTFWVGTWGDGLHTMDRETGTFTRHRHDPADPNKLSRPHSAQQGESGGVSFIVEDDAGALWIGAFGGGLNRYDPETGEIVHYEHDPNDPASLSDNNVWRMVQSRDGTLWVGTLARGINKAHQTYDAFEYYTLTPLHSNNVVNALHVDASGTLRAGTCCPDTRLIRFERTAGGDSAYRAISVDVLAPEGGTILALGETRDGMLWVGTYAGTPATRRGRLYQINPATGRYTRVLPDSARYGRVEIGPVTDIHEDTEGTLWLGTRWSGLLALDRGTGALTHYDHDPDRPSGLSHTSVTILYEAPSEPGMLWIGTEGGGLNRFDPRAGTFTSFRHDPKDPRSLSSDYVTDIYEDARGRLWVGTRRGGLNQFDRKSETFTRFDSYNSGLPDNYVACMLGDGDGNLWIGTSRGLTRFHPEAELFYTYGVEHGIQAASFESAACHRGRAGELIFGGVNGFVAFRPDQVRTDGSPPPVVLTGFHLARRPGGADPNRSSRAPLWKADEIRLAHEDHMFSFEFAALDYRDPEANQYAYMLEGYDEDWREAGTQRRASYYRVPPGAYTFRVKAASSNGVWNEEGASIQVRVLPPWWRTWWAYALYGLLVVGGSFAVDRIQRRRIVERERKRAEVREAEIRAEASEVQARVAEEHAQKLEALDAAKSRFFANVSHEFRTPLTLILGPIEDALSGRTHGLSRSQLAALHRNARRLLKLINQLLDLARIETGSMQLNRQPVDLVALLKESTTAFAAWAEREHITLSFRSDVERLPALADPDKLEKVIFNLLSNAFKFTPSGHKVHIRLRTVEEPSGMHAEITVKDTGQGIPPEKLPYIFDRFFQAGDASTQEQAGTGIGLALAKEFVELHGGRIEAESDPGFGTTFIVRLPVEENLAATEEVAPAPKEERSEEGAATAAWSMEADARSAEDEAEPGDGASRAMPGDACVLIVEDNADVRAYVRGLLMPNYRVVEAHDGEEGLEAARAVRPDLVIADIMMPGRDGLDLCRILKADAALRHIPVVLLTAKADQESRLEGLGTGADVYLAKPFDAEELLLHVENLIELRRQLRARYSETVLVGPSEIEVTSQEAAFLERVRRAVEEHLGDPDFGVERLAGEVNLSVRQLQRRLRETAGLSAAAFIRKMRLARAAQLLEQEAGTVSEVAYRVGYRSADAFGRVFRQVYGVSPSEYPRRKTPTDSDISPAGRDMREEQA